MKNVILLPLFACLLAVAPSSRAAAGEKAAPPAAQGEPLFTIASYNVWIGSRGDPKRIAALSKLAAAQKPDILGVQEASWSHLEGLLAALPPGYALVGEGRDGGRSGEFSAILLNTNRFDLLDSGTRWLSDTPEKPSKLSKSICPRIFTWARIRDRRTGRELCHLNTHLDHGLEEVRVAQGSMLLAFAKTIGLPVSMTGDFNAYEKASASYQAIVGGGFDDAKFLCPLTTPLETTWQDFGREKTGAGVLDYCFLSHGAFLVRSYRVIDSKVDGYYASDHNLVLVEASLR